MIVFFRRVLAVLIVIAGIIILSYPLVSDLLYEHMAKQKIRETVESVEKMEPAKRKEEILEAVEYNRILYKTTGGLTDPFTKRQDTNVGQDYEKILAYDQSGIMGYLTIPAINIEYPIFHGTEKKELEQGIGHVQGTSFPVGGKSSHALLAGHSGLTHKRLFTDLENLEPGDTVYVNILNEKIRYRVDTMSIVEPDDLSDTAVIPGKDLLTLITCTPYGINSHRLMVRCIREERETGDDDVKCGADERKAASTFESVRFRDYAITGVALLIMVLAGFFIKNKQKGRSPWDR